MSQSTDALLWWGCLIDEDSELHERLEDRGSDDPEEDRDDREWAEVNLVDVRLVKHCSLSAPMWGLAIASAFGPARRYSDGALKARRGFPQKVDLPDVGDDWQQKIRTAHEGLSDHLGVSSEDRQVPEYGWFLASFWEV